MTPRSAGQAKPAVGDVRGVIPELAAIPNEGVRDVQVETEFRCPACDGPYYRSSDLEGQMVRTCKGIYNDDCGFKWPEADDWKHFVVVARVAYDSADTLDVALEIIR